MQTEDIFRAHFNDDAILRDDSYLWWKEEKAGPGNFDVVTAWGLSISKSKRKTFFLKKNMSKKVRKK